MKKFLVVLFTIISANTFAAGPQSSRIAVSDLQAARNEYGLPIIKGIATNTSNTVAKEIFVKFNLYDQQGNLVGNTIAHASNLEANGQWIINALSPKEFASFAMTGVDAY